MNINQKQYLKKYSSEPKKKKRKAVTTNSTYVLLLYLGLSSFYKNIYSSVRIIDDDEYFLNDIQHDDELVFTKEDAPIIVGVIDERPPELIAEDFKNSDKWRGIISEGDNSNHVKHKQDLSPVRSQKKSRVVASPDLSPKRFASNSPDLSPKRFSSNNSSSKPRTVIKDSVKRGSTVSEKEKRDDKRTKNSTDDQEVVRRDRRTGKRITLESTLNENKEKDKHQEAKNQIYTRWGLG